MQWERRRGRRMREKGNEIGRGRQEEKGRCSRKEWSKMNKKKVRN
jgi:hypothetical protein